MIRISDEYLFISSIRNFNRPEGEPILAEALNWLGLLVLSSERDVDKARSLIQQGLELYQNWGIQHGVAFSLYNLGIVEIQSHRDELALSLLEKSLLLSRQLGDLIFVARISRYLENLLLRQQNYEKARLFFEEHLRIDTELKFWDGIGHAYGELGNLFRYQDYYGQAESAAEWHKQYSKRPVFSTNPLIVLSSPAYSNRATNSVTQDLMYLPPKVAK